MNLTTRNVSSVLMAGVYHVALQSVNVSESYDTWVPTTLQIPLQLEHGHGAHAAAIATAWETRVAEYLTGGTHAHHASVKVSCVVESTFEAAMQLGLDALTPWIFIVVAVMVLYSGVFLSTQVRAASVPLTPHSQNLCAARPCAHRAMPAPLVQVRTSEGFTTQLSLISQGSVVSGLAGISSFGWMNYLGFGSINVLCICAVFLVAAVGVDCTFIFVSAMKATGASTPLKDAIPMAMAEGASAITLTSLTSIMAFVVSAAASSAQPAFVKFNVVMALALLLNFLGFIFFFSGVQVENEHRILNGRADLAPWRARSKKRLPAWVDVGQKLRMLINNRFAPNLIDRRQCDRAMACKLAGLFVLVLTLAVSLAFVGDIGVGMPDQYLVPDSSYLYEFTRDLDALTESTRTTSVGMMVEHLDLGSPNKLAAFVADVIEPISKRDDVYTITCLPALFEAYRQASLLSGGTPSTWKDWLGGASQDSRVAHTLFGRTHFGEETGQFSGAVVPRAISCTITGVGFAGPSSVSRIEVMNWYLNLSDTLNARFADTCFPCDATRVAFFSKEWALKTSLDEELPSLCWSTIALALVTVGAVLLLALPVHRALISVLNIFLVVFAILGFMGYAGISYNLISYCTLTMAIGFCVDYTVELMVCAATPAPNASRAVPPPRS
jgi:hypothetical protein